MVSLETVASEYSTFSTAPGAGVYDLHSLDGVTGGVPLIAISLTASMDSMKGNSVDFGASYRSVGLNVATRQLGYNEVSTEFSVSAPRVNTMDFSKSIREKVENCPEKMIDKLIIDGAVGLNYSW